MRFKGCFTVEYYVYIYVWWGFSISIIYFIEVLSYGYLSKYSY